MLLFSMLLLTRFILKRFTNLSAKLAIVNTPLVIPAWAIKLRNNAWKLFTLILLTYK